MENRVEKLADSVRGAIEMADDRQRAVIEEASIIDWEMHFAFQEAQKHALAGGKLSPDEAQVVYASLGERWSESNGGWTEGTDLGTKVTILRLMHELLQMV